MKFRNRSSGCWFIIGSLIFVLFYYIASFFIGSPNITTAEDTESEDLVQTLRVNFTNNPEALKKLEDFKHTDFIHLRPKQQESLLYEYIPFIGVNGILDVLEQDAEKVHERCHNQAHTVGIAATWITDNLEILMDVIKDRCDSAAFHGVIESKLLSIRSANKNKDLKLLAPTILQICSHPSVLKIFTPGQCSHGVGYAFMMMDSEFHEATKACFDVSKFSEIVQSDQKQDNWAFYCSEGVFKNYLYNYCRCSSKLQEPCAFNVSAQGACWTYKFTEMHLNQDESTKLAKFTTCKLLPKKQQVPCLYGFGYYLSSLNSSDISLCKNSDISIDGQIGCIDGFISRVSRVDKSVDKVKRYCESIKGSEVLYKVCQNSAKFASEQYSLSIDLSNYI